MATAYELRMHLQREHQVRMVGADYGTLITVHDIEHRADQDHDHHDHARPGSDAWKRECEEFGCDDGEPA